MIHTLIKIPRNKINSKHRCIAKIFPGSELKGHFVGGKPVANRAWLATPKGVDVSKVMLTAGLEFPEK